jgi:hypothetical protein
VIPARLTAEEANFVGFDASCVGGLWEKFPKSWNKVFEGADSGLDATVERLSQSKAYQAFSAEIDSRLLYKTWG